MDAKLTLSFDKDIVERAKKYAAEQNISLSRLIEHLLTQVTAKPYPSLEDFPISDWVRMISEGEIEYKKTPPSSRKSSKEDFFSNKK
ncbi:DUF6364 family protein [Pedobacter sp.]|uniref:DUF6364 family protein n=1 Tax=Pedobacter sp. TaxID=1411316 RepID=UPI003BABCDBD